MTRFSSGLRWLGASVLLLTASACATGNPEARRSAGPISRAELDSVNAFVVDEAVDLLRPTWMARLQGACYAEEPPRKGLHFRYWIILNLRRLLILLCVDGKRRFRSICVKKIRWI